MKKHVAILLSLVILLTVSGCHAPAEAVKTAAPTQAAEPAQTEIQEENPEPKMQLVSITIEGISGDTTNATTQEFHYDEKGFLSEIISYADGAETGRSTFICDEKGNPLKETNISGGVTTVTESELTYNEDGWLVAKTDTVTKDGIVTDVREYEYLPETGKYTKAVFYRSGETEPYSSNTYEYDDQGRDILQISENSGMVTRNEAEYDDQGRKLRSVQMDPQGEVRMVVTYSYEDGGKVVQTVTAPDGTVLYTMTQVEYEEGNTKISETYMGDALMTRTSSTYAPLQQEG